MAGTPKSRPSDLTGRQREAAAQANAEEQARRASEIAMVTAAEAEQRTNEVVDLTNPEAPKVVEDKDLVREIKDDGTQEVVDLSEAKQPSDVETVEVSTKEKMVIIRVNESVEMTYAGVLYDLEVGRKYKVPEHIAAHLEERDMVWH